MLATIYAGVKMTNLRWITRGIWTMRRKAQVDRRYGDMTVYIV